MCLVFCVLSFVIIFDILGDVGAVLAIDMLVDVKILPDVPLTTGGPKTRISASLCKFVQKFANLSVIQHKFAKCSETLQISARYCQSQQSYYLQYMISCNLIFSVHTCSSLSNYQGTSTWD